MLNKKKEKTYYRRFKSIAFSVKSQAICTDFTTCFENLLMKANEVNIHLTNLQRLMTHMYKCVNNVAPPISRDTFIPKQNPYNIRNFR